MTREEAIEYGTEWLKDEYLDSEDRAFIKTALEALEQQPCEDAISRQAVISLFDGSLEEAYPAISKTINKCITVLPSVNPQKTGHWRHYEGMLICSECGSEFYDDIMEYCGDDVPKCCPNCGAKMVEPQEGSGEV